MLPCRRAGNEAEIAMTRWLGPILCVVGAAVMTLALLGHRWGAVGPAGRGARIGLLDAIRCDGPCETIGHGATEATRIEGEQFARLGQAAFVFGLLAALGGAIAAHPRARRRLARWVTLLVAASVAAATAFLVTEPYGQLGRGWTPGLAWWLVAGGGALVVAGVHAGPATAPRRWPAWLALTAAALVLAIGTHSTSWWTGTVAAGDDAVRVGVGPAMVEYCVHGCDQVRLGDAAWAADVIDASDRGLPAPQADLMRDVADGVFPEPGSSRLGPAALVFGRGVPVAAATAALLAAALALLTAARRPARRLAWLAAAAAGAVVIAAIGFELSLHARTLHHIGRLHRSLGMPYTLAGAVTATVAAVWLGRVAAARAPAVAAPAETAGPALPVLAAPPAPIETAAPIAPPCPRCGAPMLWVSKREAWLCTMCRDGAAT
jgi:hypothetical protein